MRDEKGLRGTLAIVNPGIFIATYFLLRSTQVFGSKKGEKKKNR